MSILFLFVDYNDYYNNNVEVWFIFFIYFYFFYNFLNLNFGYIYYNELSIEKV